QRIPEIQSPKYCHQQGKQITHDKINSWNYKKQKTYSGKNLAYHPNQYDRDIIDKPTKKVGILDLLFSADFVGHQKKPCIQRSCQKHTEQDGKVIQMDGK